MERPADVTRNPKQKESQETAVAGQLLAVLGWPLVVLAYESRPTDTRKENWKCTTAGLEQHCVQSIIVIV
jgi:hypothetical protein